MSPSEDFPLDFTPFHEDIFPDWIGQFRSGKGIGEYSWEKGGPTSLYGTTDMIYSLYDMDCLDLSEAEKDAWAATINQFQDPETGWYLKTYTMHFREHTTAYAVGALKLIDRSPAHPMHWKDEILASRKTMEKWINQKGRAIWSAIWSGSHVISGVPAILAMTGEGTEDFFEWYFDWLDAHADPESGFWRRGWAHKIHFLRKPNMHDMAGAFHMYYVYDYFDRKWPYPERIVDWTLGMQHENGFWNKEFTYCIDLDGLYNIIRSSLNAGKYRWDDIRAACIRYIKQAHATMNDRDFFFNHYMNSHLPPGAISAIAEVQKYFPDLVKTPVSWRQHLDVVCYV